MTDNAVAKPKGTLSWALWDWASQSFPTIITSFVFSRYITDSVFAPAGLSEEAAAQYTGYWLGISGVIAGILVAVIAPLIGARADRAGRKKYWLMVNTYLFAISIGLMFFVAPSPDFFMFGLILLAVGGIFFEFATVNYNALLNQVSAPHERGKVSQFGWGLGYMGGIVLLVISLWIIQFGGAEMLGIPDEAAMPIRVVMIMSMVWVLVFSLPMLLRVPESKGTGGAKPSFVSSYKKLFKDLAGMRKNNPELLKFLIASAVYRDGLNGVFAYGAVLGGLAFGLGLTEIIIFGIGANILAGVGAFVSAFFEDRYGSKKIILISLAGVMVGGIGVFVFFFAGWGVWAYFIFGLFLTLFVGPAQAGSRTLMSRLSHDDRQGEAFGLFATTGRAVSFLAPAAWAFFVWAFSPIWGILGLISIILVGFGLLLMVRVSAFVMPDNSQTAA
jgi:MFS transporter, UMF1 family